MKSKEKVEHLKFCPNCGKKKPIEEFHKEGAFWIRCKSCFKRNELDLRKRPYKK